MSISARLQRFLSTKEMKVSAVIGSLSAKFSAAVLSFAVAIILGRLLGAEGYGAYAYAISWLTILSLLAAFGLDILAIREIAQTVAKEEWNILRGFVSWSLKRVTLSGIGLAAGMTAVIWLVRDNLSPGEANALWVAALVLPGLAILRLLLGMIQGFGKPVWAQIPQLVLLPTVLLMIAGLLWLYDWLNGQRAVGAYGLATAMALAASIWLLLKSARPIPSTAAPVVCSERWTRSARALMLGGFGAMFNNHIGVIMLGTLSGPQQAATFDVAMKASTLVAFVLMAVNIPMGPVLATQYAKSDREGLQHLATKGAWIALAGALPAAAGLTMLGPWFLKWMGEGFSTGSIALGILCLGQLINAACGSVGLILNMTGHEHDTARAVFVSGILNAVFCLILIPNFGIEGAAISAAISMAIWNLRLVERVFHRTRINPTIFRF